MTTFAPKSIIIPATGSYPEHALRVLSDDGVTLTA